MNFDLILLFASLASANIHQFAVAGDLTQVKDALAQGVDINSRDASGNTPLMIATLGGQYEVVEYLLKAGADVTVAENMGYTPMHGAGFQGRASLVPLLISFGVERDAFHEDGFAPIHRACWGNEPRHTETVAAFLKAGTSPGLLSEDGRSPLEISQNEGTRKILREAKRKHEHADEETKEL